MKDSENNPVLLNLQDSVSRIVDNLGFTSIDNTAHAKLVSIMAEMIHSMSQTCRLLAENARRSPFSLTTVVDIKHLFRMHHIDLEGLVEYVRQVRPFPPREFEIHGNNKTAICNAEKKIKKKVATIAPGSSVINQPSRAVSSIPVFDDMDYYELGFSETEPSASPVQQPPPPPPPPLPPLPSLPLLPPLPLPPPPPPPPTATFEIPVFDPEVPPPPINVPPPQNYTSPGFVPKHDEPVPVKAVQNYLAKQDEREEVTKPRYVKSENLKTYPLERPSSSLSSTGPKKTRKRQMQSNYERRLRDEHLAEEEKQKERRERKRMKAAMAVRRSAEREGEKERKVEEKRPSTVFNIRTLMMNELSREQNESGETTFLGTDENENKKMNAKKATASISTSSASASSSADDVTGQKPLPKLLIRFKRVPRGILVKKVIRTKYRWKDGQWKAKEREWKNNRGVLSQTEDPHKKPSTGYEPIPKITLIRKADGSYKIK